MLIEWLRREEEFIYSGQADFGLEGLLKGSCHREVQGADWSSLDAALDAVLAAITRLDDHGFHGPYALALPAAHYNKLFRHYEHIEQLQIEHLKSLCTRGVCKATLEKPVVVDNQAATAVLGQDLRVGHAGCDGIH